MLKLISSGPNEFLVVGRKGRVRNLGTAATKWLLPGSTWVTIPSTKQETCFEMTQESKDGIPLRLKGIAIYRVIDAAACAHLFDFASGEGHDDIKGLMAHVCLGELRSIVANMNMRDCIEHRKDILTKAVTENLRRVVAGNGQGGWGIELDIVQVAQVFVIDQDIRVKLEAELRNALTARSELADLNTKEKIQRAKVASDRRVQQEELESEREAFKAAEEKLYLEKALEQKRIAANKPVRMLEIQNHREIVEQSIEGQRLSNVLKALKVENALAIERAQHELRKEMVPLEQVPEVAKALAQMFQGADLSIYGSEAATLGHVAPLIDFLVQRLGGPKKERSPDQ